MDELRAHWAQRLRAARLDRGLTQEQLADLAGISQVRLSSYELAVNIPRDEVRIRLAKALGLQVYDIFVYPDVTADEEETNGGEAA